MKCAAAWKRGGYTGGGRPVWMYAILRESLCSRGAQRVLRSCDMEYVMLHLYSVYLMPGEGQLSLAVYGSERRTLSYSTLYTLST